MSTLIQLLDRPIAYNPAFAKLRAGKIKAGPVAAVFLSQIVYWHNRMKGEWLYKTQADITAETALTRDEQETARKRLVALGVLEEARRGVPATMHYRINVERLETLLLETTEQAKPTTEKKSRSRQSQIVETPQCDVRHNVENPQCGNPANKNVETPQSSMREPPAQECGDPTIFLTGDYTENTQETTQNKNSCTFPPETHDPAQVVLDYFNRITDSRYRDGKTTGGLIRGRLSENYSVEDLKLVVDYTTAKWLNDPKMRDYLRPKTIFGIENCMEYFEKARKWTAAGRPRCIDGKWVNSDGDEYLDKSERDAAYKRFMGSALPLKNPSELETRVRTEASKAGVRSMNASFAVSRWNSIWKNCLLSGNKA